MVAEEVEKVEMVEEEADVEVIAGGPDIGTEERRASPTRNTRGGTLRGKRAGKGSSTGRRGEEGAADIGKQRRGRGVVQAGQRPKRGAGQGPRHLREGGEGGGKGRPATDPASQQPPGVVVIEVVEEEEEKVVAEEVAVVEAEEC